ncbi:MAG: polysaccharide deacetylase family protein, partial [Candidatus Symbiothrix sp.]|nr:polysaccharide deacetylase family protein [Candidatus Symbiothrix sp.]
MYLKSLKPFLVQLPAFLTGLHRLIRSTGEPVVNVFYHTVSDNYLPHIHPLYAPKSVRTFRQDLDYLLKYFQAVDIHAIRKHVSQEKKITQPSFHLSFDDGLSEVYHNALPVLMEKGIPATVFVNSRFVDNQELFFRHKAALIIDKLRRQKGVSAAIQKIKKINSADNALLDVVAAVQGIDFQDYLQQQQPYLTVEQLKTMQKNGFTIGGHSIDHPHYSLLSEEEQIRQTVESCLYVRDVFHEPALYFAFPFSDGGVKDTFFP